MLKFFLEICREDYFGIDDDASESKMVHEICKNNFSLRMEYGSKSGNCLTTDIPDELYDKVISILAGLLKDAKKWSLSLCNSCFANLVVPV